MGYRQGRPQDGVSAELRFIRRAVELYQSTVDFRLVGGGHPDNGFGDSLIDVGHRLEDALAVIAGLIAVAELHGFVFAGAGAGGHGGPAGGAVGKL